MPDTPRGSAALLAEWREQEGPGRRYPFAAPDDERCESVHRAPAAPKGCIGDDQMILYRCGKRSGHENSRHECSDAGAWTLKWGS